jgi:hypothetical protein
VVSIFQLPSAQQSIAFSFEEPKQHQRSEIVVAMATCEQKMEANITTVIQNFLAFKMVRSEWPSFLKSHSNPHITPPRCLYPSPQYSRINHVLQH